VHFYDMLFEIIKARPYLIRIFAILSCALPIP
jgi:hypothetical protein